MSQKLNYNTTRFTKIKSQRQKATRLLLITASLSFLPAFMIMLSEGHSFSSLFSVKSLLELANQNSVKRYAGELQIPFIAKILVSFSYVSASIIGIKLAIGIKRKAEVYIILFSLFPPLLMTILLTTKASTLYFVVMIASAYLATQVILGQKKLIRARQVKYLLILVILILGLVFTTAHLRVGHLEMTNTQIFNHYRSSFFGYLSGFSEWLNEYIQLENSENSFGKYTFAGPYQLLGISTRESGLYTEANSTKGNIYTIFRGFIEDFGLSGSLLFTFLFGAISGFAYKNVSYGKVSYIPLLTIVYAMILWSLFVSITIYSSVLLSSVILFGLIKIIIRKYYFKVTAKS